MGTRVRESGPGFRDEGGEWQRSASEVGREDEGPAASKDADETEARGASRGWEVEIQGLGRELSPGRAIPG